MALVFNGSTNTIGGLAVGGVPDGTIDEDALAANSVVTGKITDATIAMADLSAGVAGGVAKAWLHLDMTNGDIDGSFGISAVTDQTTGDFTATFSSALTDVNYAAVACTSDSGLHAQIRFTGTSNNSSASQVRFRALDGGGSGHDDPHFSIAVLR